MAAAAATFCHYHHQQYQKQEQAAGEEETCETRGPLFCFIFLSWTIELCVCENGGGTGKKGTYSSIFFSFFWQSLFEIGIIF